MKNSAEVLLRVDGLSCCFGRGVSEFRAVDGISFEIKSGEVFGLVGESGCGKTTTGRAIIRINGITDGNIYFKGQRISAGIRSYEEALRRTRVALKAIRCDELGKRGVLKDIIAIAKQCVKRAESEMRTADKICRKKIQMIFQDPSSSLDPRMTVREIIAEGLVINGERSKERINARVDEMLRLVGLQSEHADRYPHEFSGGQKQRIGIARALVMEPELIIADEPVSALDVSVQAQVVNLLSDLRERFGLAVLFIAHDLSVVKYLSDRIGVMHSGKIVELAEADELFSHPLHPYTVSLLSAIPYPDPIYERSRRRRVYDKERDHDYTKERPTMREVSRGHFVYCNSEELRRYREILSEERGNDTK